MPWVLCLERTTEKFLLRHLPGTTNDHDRRQQGAFLASIAYFSFSLTTSTALLFHPHHWHHIASDANAYLKTMDLHKKRPRIRMYRGLWGTSAARQHKGAQVCTFFIVRHRLSLPPFSSFLQTSIFTSWHQFPYIQPPAKSISFSALRPASSRRYPSSSDSLRPQSPWLSARGWPEASPPNWLPTTPPYVVSLSFLGT